MPEVMPGQAEVPAWAIVPAGGTGSRFSTSQNKNDKLLMPLQGLPVLVHTVRALLAVPAIRGVILVAGTHSRATYETVMQTHCADSPVYFALGGATRRDSVAQGLQALKTRMAESAGWAGSSNLGGLGVFSHSDATGAADDNPIVVIHDAARPLVRPETVMQAIGAVRQGQAGAIVASPVHDTVKEVRPGTEMIGQTIDRSRLWRAQTPQVFPLATLWAAHTAVPVETPVTDDAQLLELAGLGPVVLVPGEETNLKITQFADLLVAEALLASRDASRP